MTNPVSCTTDSSLFHMLSCFYNTWNSKLRSLLERSQREPPPMLRSDNVHSLHLPDSTHNSSTRLLLLLSRVFAAQTAQESCVYHGLRVVHRLIGSTHGLGWVGSDCVEIFYSIFSELGLVVARKKWSCPLLLTNFDTLTPQNSEN